MGPPGALRRLLGNPSLLLLVILTAQLMVVLDTTIVNVALPHIQRSLGFSASGLSWVLNTYILTFGGCCSWAPGQATCSVDAASSSPASPCSP